MLHWQNLPKSGTIPHANTFLDAAPARVMPHVIIHEHVPEGFRVRFMGTALVHFWQADHTGTFKGEGAPPALRAELERTTAMILQQPCGLVQIGDTQSTQGRALAFESVTLPLAVDADRPPRVVTCTMLIDPPARNEFGHTILPKVERAWIDLGAGIPSETVGTAS